jgi:hypothetical protein
MATSLFMEVVARRADGLPPRHGYAGRFPALTYNDRFRKAKLPSHLWPRSVLDWNAEFLF